MYEADKRRCFTVQEICTTFGLKPDGQGEKLGRNNVMHIEIKQLSTELSNRMDRYRICKNSVRYCLQKIPRREWLARESGEPLATGRVV